MKRSSVGLVLFLFFSSFSVFAQVDTTWITDPFHEVDIDLSAYKLVEGKTFTYRESSPGVKTDSYFDMTSWDSSPYTQGYLARSWGEFVINYRLLTPLSYTPSYTEGFPLIVMMHGAGERGNCWNGSCYWGGTNPLWNAVTNAPNSPFPAIPTTSTSPAAAYNANGTTWTSGTKYYPAQVLNNDHSLSIGASNELTARNLAGTKLPNDPTLPSRAFPGFVLHVQSLNGWSGGEKDVVRIVRLLTKKYKIDQNKIYVHGLSNGGQGVYQIVKIAPWLIAGALPMSAIDDVAIVEQDASKNYIDRIANVPIWQFQGGTDTAPKPAKSQYYINTFLSRGLDAKLTIYPSLGHGVWNNAYAEPNFWTWMLGHNKANIHVMYGNNSICATSGAGVDLRLAYGFLGYQWERDGEVIPGATAAAYVATIPGTYRARFSRILNPSEAQWNKWSAPVVVTESNVPAADITVSGSTHLPSINGDYTVNIKGQAGYRYFYWYKNNSLMNVEFWNFPKDTVDNINVNQYGGATYAVEAADIQKCKTPRSKNVVIVVDAPQTLTAPSSITGVITSPSSINLFWTDNTNNETNFEIYRALQGDTNYEMIGLTDPDVVSFQDTGLEPNTSYDYKLRAINNTARSPYTAAFTISTTLDTQAPTPPQNLRIVDEDITAITVEWDPSTDNSGINNYVVTYAPATGFTGNSGTATTVGTETTLKLNGLTRDRIYNISVKAVDLALPTNNTSPSSNSIQAETVKKGLDYTHSEGAWTTLYTGSGANSVNYTKIEYTGKTSVVTIAPRVQDDFFYFRFEGYIYIPTGQNGTYNFQLTAKEGSALFIGTNGFNPTQSYNGNADRVVNNDFIKQSGIPTTASGSKNLSQNTAYRISVIFFEYTGANETLDLTWRLGNSGAFTPIPASAFRSGPVLTTPTPPAAPTSLVATAPGQSSINLTWNYTGSATYEIYRSLTLAGTYEVINQTSNKSFLDTGLDPGTTYYYKVKSLTANGTSAFSNIANATTTTDITAPSVPTNLQLLTQTYTSAGLTWTVSTDNVEVTDYNIYANNVLIGNSTTNTYTATGLLPNTNYTFQVTALDASNNESAKSTGVAFTTSVPDIYYYAGSGALDNVNSWGKAADGSGVHPTDFSVNGQYFNVTNVGSASVANAWTVGGTISKVIVKAGTTLSINSAMSGNLDAEAGAIVNVNNALIPEFNSLDPSSTVNLNTYTAIPLANYGNLNLNGSGVKNLVDGITTVAGNLTVANGITLKGLPGNTSGLTVQGNLTVSGALTEPASDNNITLRFAGANPSIISTSGNLGLYEFIGDVNKDITFTNTSGTPVNIRLGSTNGGGLTLNNGSVFRIANNNLVLRFSAKVNGASETGRIHIAGGDIDFTSDTNVNSLFNFHPSANNVDYLNLQLTGTGTATIGETALITDGIKIKSGVLNANGKIILESNAAGTASIRQIESGSIQGSVTVKRYASAQGKVYRYFSIPVAGVTVANLQQYVDITGYFTGATSQSSNSLFKYNETLGGWKGFPANGGSNSETFTKGVGYSMYYYSGNAPVTYQVSGNPYQGDVPFTGLTGGTGASGNGWNLLGNPYACPIIWGATGWTTSGISNTVYVRYNTSPTTFEYRYWSTANGGTGSLAGGKIPAGQSFWVQATNGSPAVTVRESAKSNDPGTSNTQYFREGPMDFGKFEITLSNGVNTDPTYVLISPDGQDQFAKGLDAEKRPNSSLNLSTHSSDSINLAINIMSNSFCSKTVGLNLQNVVPGNYTLALKQEDWTGTIMLHDALTNSTFDLSSGSEYAFAITTDTKTFGKNRFTIQLGNPAVNISNTAVNLSANGICEGETANVTFTNTQKGITYSVVNENGAQIVDPQVATGESLTISIPGIALNQGTNNLKFVAEWNGCLTLEFPVTKQLNYGKPPEVVVPQLFITACSDENVTLVAQGAPEGGSYQWFEESATNPIKGQTSSTLSLPSLSNSTLFLVRAVTQYGCVSEFKGIHVEPVTLQRPAITELDNILYSSVEENVQWYRDNQSIPGATMSYLEKTAPGVYTVQASLSGCTKVSEEFIYSITGIENKLSDGTFLTVYPNPTSPEKINIKGYVPAAETANILLVDIYGKTLMTLSITAEEFSQGTTLNTSGLSLASGMYFVYLQKGKTMIRSKVIIR